MSGLHEEARELLPAVTELRRAIHSEPELGLELPLTQQKVMSALEGLPLTIRSGKGTTWVMADLRGTLDGPGRSIILRGDMDALPLQEDTDVPFKSRLDGRMHACGHDSHTAMLVGAARLLARHQADFAGTVRFMFQPGEEGFAGAKVMLNEGLLVAPESGSPPVAAFALHSSPRNAAGTINTRPGPSAASADSFDIVVRGRGGHASAPHLAADPVPVACEIVTAIQTMVTRSINIFSPGVVTVGQIKAGTTDNIIPEVATLSGTVRTLSDSTRARIHDGLHRLAHGVASAHGLDAEIIIEEGYPVTVNDAEFVRFVLDVARDTLGAENAIEAPFPLMAAEDFSYVLQELPGAMASLGTRPDGYGEGEAPNNHSNRVLLNEKAMAAGVAMHAGVALAFLRR